MKLECLELRETGTWAEFSSVDFKYRVICFMQTVAGASRRSGWDGSSARVKQQLLPAGEAVQGA